MRIVVSGTHASGKSTLVADIAAAVPGVETLPDPFGLVDAALDEPDAETYLEQLHHAAARLRGPRPDHLVVAERGPLDLLAYLEALVQLDRPGADEQAALQARTKASAAMSSVDVVLLLEPADVSEQDEDPSLRRAVHAVLLDLLDDPDLVGAAQVIDVAGGVHHNWLRPRASSRPIDLCSTSARRGPRGLTAVA